MAPPVFSVRFKDAQTKAMLQTVAQQTGRSMNDIVEQAVGAGADRPLDAALSAFKSRS